jgi:two-component system invasion response regulator UvrY
MTGGTLAVSRDVNNHSHYKKRFEELGFKNINVTAVDKDGLNMVINEQKPRLLIMGSRFYECATPYMIGLLLRRYPGLKIAVVSIFGYPVNLASGLIINGVKSYVNFAEGIDQFYAGLAYIREGRNYISPAVEECMETGNDNAKPTQELTERQIEGLRLLCNGFTTLEMADVLHISLRTVKFHKSELYNNLKVRNENELIRVAIYLGFIQVDELDFYGGEYGLNHKLVNKEKIRRIYAY